MLVLTRRVADQILVPSLGITLEVLSIRGNVVKLGVTAPQELLILRGELAGSPEKARQFQSLKKQDPQKADSSKTENPLTTNEVEDVCPAQASPLGSYLRKSTEDISPSNRTDRKDRAASPQPVLFLADDAPESVCETRTAYEVSSTAYEVCI